MSDIFISYSRADYATAQMLANILEKQGRSVWWDRSLLPGDKIDNIIKEELRTAKCVIVLWSSNSIVSDWVKDEASEGAKRGILIPLLIEDVELPLGFRRIQTERLMAWNGEISHPTVTELMMKVEDIISGQIKIERANGARVEEKATLRLDWLRYLAIALLAIILVIGIWGAYQYMNSCSLDGHWVSEQRPDNNYRFKCTSSNSFEMFLIDPSRPSVETKVGGGSITRGKVEAQFSQIGTGYVANLSLNLLPNKERLEGYAYERGSSRRDVVSFRRVQ